MSSFTTEETVTTITRTFIKGTFTGKYNAERNDERDSRHSEFYRMNIYSAEIRIEAVRQHNEGDFPEALAVKPFGGTIGQPVRCYDPNSNTYFELTLNEPKINDPVLSLITKEGAKKPLQCARTYGVPYADSVDITWESFRDDAERRANPAIYIKD